MSSALFGVGIGPLGLSLFFLKSAIICYQLGLLMLHLGQLFWLLNLGMFPKGKKLPCPIPTLKKKNQEKKYCFIWTGPTNPNSHSRMCLLLFVGS